MKSTLISTALLAFSLSLWGQDVYTEQYLRQLASPQTGTADLILDNPIPQAARLYDKQAPQQPEESIALRLASQDRLIAAQEKLIALQSERIADISANLSVWMTVIGIFVAILGAGGALIGYIIRSNLKEDIARTRENCEKEIAIISKQARLEIDNARLSVKNAIAAFNAKSKEADTYLSGIRENKKVSDDLLDKMQNKPQDITPEEKAEIKEAAGDIIDKLSASDWFTLAYNARINGYYDEACFYYMKSIEKETDPYEKAGTYNKWGNMLVDMAKIKDDKRLFAESFEKYRKATELNPDYVDAYYNWGISLLKLAQIKGNLTGYKNEIESKFKKAHELDDTDASYNLARLYSLTANCENAIDWLETAIVKDKFMTREMIEEEPDFAGIRPDSRYAALINKYFPKNNY